jgi:hypothetical protein
VGSHSDRLVAIAKLIDFASHFLSHRQQQVAHVRIRVGRATAQSVVFAWFIELVALEVTLIEIEMAAVLETEIGSTGEHDWKIRVAMTVAVTHAASE